MKESFLDEVKIFVMGGRGGNGCISFRREKFVPRGGPDGGDGGTGGSVFLQIDPSLTTLESLRHRHHFRAEKGLHGQGQRKTGSSGKDVILPVPPGTLVYDVDRVSLLGDLQELPGKPLLVASGGRGGLGNSHFATSTHQTPRFAGSGEEAEEFWIWLELKAISDVGLVGLPNSGKSTLLSRISAARPRIGSYPFSTLVPCLGIVETDDYERFTVADIPGLIEGAHQGQGLGDRFLRHLERSRILVHLIDVSDKMAGDPVNDLKILREELWNYLPELGNKPQILVANKIDAAGSGGRLRRLEEYCRKKGEPVFKISALHSQGLGDLLKTIQKKLQALGPRVWIAPGGNSRH